MIYVLSSPTNYKYGFWRVIFPPGSACTLTNGTKTYKAPASAVEIGRYSFPIPERGQWTVSCTDGTHTASKTQTISMEYSYFATTLSYEVYYYNNGDVSSLTGGWNNATVGTSLSAKIEVRSDGYAQTLTVTSKNTINLAGINTIHVIGTMTASGNLSTAKFSIGGSSVSVSGESGKTNNLTDFSLDVSSVSSGQFTFTLNSGLGYSSISISKIYGT